MKRILAWAGILLIAAAFIGLLYLTATGASARAIMALIFSLLVIPVIIYAFLMMARLNRKDQESEEDNGRK